MIFNSFYVHSARHHHSLSANIIIFHPCFSHYVYVFSLHLLTCSTNSTHTEKRTIKNIPPLFQFSLSLNFISLLSTYDYSRKNDAAKRHLINKPLLHFPLPFPIFPFPISFTPPFTPCLVKITTPCPT